MLSEGKAILTSFKHLLSPALDNQLLHTSKCTSNFVGYDSTRPEVTWISDCVSSLSFVRVSFRWCYDCHISNLHKDVCAQCKIINLPGHCCELHYYLPVFAVGSPTMTSFSSSALQKMREESSSRRAVPSTLTDEE